MDAHGFLVALSIVLGVAAVTTVLFQRLRQPVVLGYILAGFIIGPNVPVPLVADRQVIQTLSELGVILLMFSLGLEFSLGKLVRLGPSADPSLIGQRLGSMHYRVVASPAYLRKAGKLPKLGPAKILDALAFAYDNEEVILADIEREEQLLDRAEPKAKATKASSQQMDLPFGE